MLDLCSLPDWSLLLLWTQWTAVVSSASVWLHDGKLSMGYKFINSSRWNAIPFTSHVRRSSFISEHGNHAVYFCHLGAFPVVVAPASPFPPFSDCIVSQTFSVPSQSKFSRCFACCEKQVSCEVKVWMTVPAQTKNLWESTNVSRGEWPIHIVPALWECVSLIGWLCETKVSSWLQETILQMRFPFPDCFLANGGSNRQNLSSKPDRGLLSHRTKNLQLLQQRWNKTTKMHGDAEYCF